MPTDKPGKSLFPQRLTGHDRHLLDRGGERSQLRRLTYKLPQRLGPEEHFIGVTHYSRPAQITNLIHNLHRTCAAGRQVAAMNDQVGGNSAQIRQHCLKRGLVAVDVGDNGDAHLLRSRGRV